MSVAHRVTSEYSLKATCLLALASLVGGALLRLVTPSSLVVSVFVGLLAWVLLCVFFVSLGKLGALTWRRILTYPLAVLGLWSVPRPASPASVRGNLFLVAAVTLAGFTLAQLLMQ